MWIEEKQIILGGITGDDIKYYKKVMQVTIFVNALTFVFDNKALADLLNNYHIREEHCVPCLQLSRFCLEIDFVDLKPHMCS